MNDLSIIHIFSPNILAGAERVVITGLNALSETQENITLILIRELRSPEHVENFKRLIAPKVNVIILDSKGAFDLKLILKIRETINNISNPIIHTHGYKALILTFLAIKKKYPFIHTHHGNTSHTLKVKFYEWIAIKIMNQINFTVCVSPLMKKILENKISSKKLAIINNMLSLKNASKIREKRKIKINREKLEMLYIGRLSPEKGIFYFLENLDKFSFFNHYQLTILGDGPQKNEIIQYIENNNLKNQIKFVGFISDPTSFYEEADLLIMPSFTEGLPMTLIESLAVGLPVIANDVGAISLLLNKNNGILIKDNNLEQWSLALIEFKQNYQKITQSTLELSFSTEERFSVENWVNQTIILYKSI